MPVESPRHHFVGVVPPCGKVSGCCLLDVAALDHSWLGVSAAQFGSAVNEPTRPRHFRRVQNDCRPLSVPGHRQTRLY